MTAGVTTRASPPKNEVEGLGAKTEEGGIRTPEAGLVSGYTSALRSTPPISARASRGPRPIAEGWVKLWIYPG
jgi:hypothetical protein